MNKPITHTPMHKPLTHTPTYKAPAYKPPTEPTVMASYWFSPMGGALIGIVMVETPYDGIVFFIGTAAGHNRASDEQRIASTGAPFPWRVGMEMFGREIEADPTPDTTP